MPFPTIFGDNNTELKLTRKYSYPALLNKCLSEQCPFMVANFPDSFTVFDVRGPEDFTKERLPNSYNLMFDFQTKPFVDAAKFAEIMDSRPGTVAVVYCSSAICRRALFSTMVFGYIGCDKNKEGLSTYPVRVLDGGFESWKAKNLPTESGPRSKL